MQFRNPNNSRVTTSYISSNLHYEARPGEWETPDLNFRLQGADHLLDRHWFSTKVSDIGIEVLDKDTNVGIRWLTGRPAVAGNVATLSERGVTWTWTVGPRRLKLAGLVVSPLGLRTHSFRYLTLGAGEDFRIVAGSAVTPGLRVSPPIIIGANQQIYSTTGWSLGAGSRLNFSFDDSVLPPEAYPYIIDPTTTLQPDSGGFDAWMKNDASTENHGSDTFMHLADIAASASRNYRPIIKFDVSSIDSDDTVTSVTFSLYEYSAGDDGSPTSWATNLQRVRRDWEEGGVTWDNWKAGNAWTTGGATDTTNDIHSTVSAALTLDGTAANAFVDWIGSTLDTDVQKFVDGGYSNYGWRVAAPTAESAGAENSFRSSDYATAADRPKLVVVHTTPSSFIPRVMVY